MHSEARESGDDSEKQKPSSGSDGSEAEQGKERPQNTNPTESPVWQDLKPHKGKTKTDGKGRKKRFYEWDYTHGDIEVYDRNGKHLGSMDPKTGKMYKPAEPGREIKP